MKSCHDRIAATSACFRFGPEPLPLSRLIALTGHSTFSVPYTLGKSVLKRLWALRLTSFPAPELDFIRYVCMVDDSKAKTELGFKPAYSTEQAVRALSSER